MRQKRPVQFHIYGRDGSLKDIFEIQDPFKADCCFYRVVQEPINKAINEGREVRIINLERRHRPERRIGVDDRRTEERRKVDGE